MMEFSSCSGYVASPMAGLIPIFCMGLRVGGLEAWPRWYFRLLEEETKVSYGGQVMVHPWRNDGVFRRRGGKQT